MVFSSLPVYNLDPPNWPQQHQEATSGGGGGGNNQNSQLPPLPLHGGGGGGGGGVGSIRPGFMVDRARLAKIPPPEPSQKCPRCDSTNTKFCYYNNYNLSQPRHFCKTCRRYWTKGGALRNVPVGGGCRRNKKNKSGNSSKSAPASTTTTTSSSAINSSEISGNVLPQQNTHLPFMSSLPNLSQYGNLGNMGFNFGGLIGGSSTSVGGANGNPENSGFQTNSVGVHHQQQQFSNFLEAASAGLYPFPGSEGIEGSSSARVSQLASVKMENNNLGLQNLTRPVFFGNFDNNNNISSGNNNNDNNNNSRNHFWGGNNWSTGTGL